MEATGWGKKNKSNPMLGRSQANVGDEHQYNITCSILSHQRLI